MSGPFLLGLTGSIGMGKSTTAAMFAEAGIPVWDADACVHRLYGPGGAVVPILGAAFPEAIRDGAIDRAALKARIAADPDALGRLESLVHPLVAADRSAFIAAATAKGAPLVVLDIPLLFETAAESTLDATLVVTAPADIQRARVLERPKMTPEHLAQILSRQMPDAEKRARATYVIETTSIEAARSAVQSVIRDITAKIRKGTDNA